MSEWFIDVLVLSSNCWLSFFASIHTVSLCRKWLMCSVGHTDNEITFAHNHKYSGSIACWSSRGLMSFGGFATDIVIWSNNICLIGSVGWKSATLRGWWGDAEIGREVLVKECWNLYLILVFHHLRVDCHCYLHFCSNVCYSWIEWRYVMYYQAIIS